MYEAFIPTREPVTPEYALEVLRDAYRQQCRLEAGADPDIELSFSTTVAEWRQACDLLPWRQVADAYSLEWGIQCSHKEWEAGLEPAEQRTLRDVCNLLARYGKLPQSRPAVLFGSPCFAGGTFLTIRSLLREAGADTGDIAPSTPLASYARRYLNVFLGPISWLAPGALPPVRIYHPIYDLTICGLFVGPVLMIVGTCTSLLPWWFGPLVFVASYGMNWFAASCLGPSRVEFGQLKTFRDLATVISEHRRI